MTFSTLTRHPRHRAWASGLALVSMLCAMTVTAPPASALAPSFNCANASNATEAAICESPDLAMYDLNLANVYKRRLGELGGTAHDAAIQAQKDWLATRDACGADASCLTTAYSRRIADLSSQITTPVSDVTFPHPARSWGGVLRDGPGLSHARIGSLAAGTEVSLLENTGVMMNDYPWFRVGYSGGSAYQWGGILCAVGSPVPGAYQTCE
ncbi:MAG: lysozyme inhibitor LprI family protein [Pseudomonadota bacterium]